MWESEFWGAVFCLIVYSGSTWLLTWVVMELLGGLSIK